MGFGDQKGPHAQHLGIDAIHGRVVAGWCVVASVGFLLDGCWHGAVDASSHVGGPQCCHPWWGPVLPAQGVRTATQGVASMQTPFLGGSVAGARGARNHTGYNIKVNIKGRAADATSDVLDAASRDIHDLHLCGRCGGATVSDIMCRMAGVMPGSG